MMDKSCSSFIGLYPMPQRYGLTIGECAKLFNDEYGIGCDLEVVPMSGYRREMFFSDTALEWVSPSPAIPTAETCFTYNCSCIFEGTNVSEGRGTAKPFSFIGAPWINAENLAQRMNGKGLPGVYFRSHYFTPVYGMSSTSFATSKYRDELCRGLEIHVIDKKSFRPIKTGITLLFEIRDKYSAFEFLPPYAYSKHPMIDYNTGNTYVREGKYSLEKVLQIYEEESKAFREIKSKYHIYGA
jgi:uncharacterized protein YbbC (DUF1343 family)